MAWNYANLWESVAAATPDRPALIHGERRIAWKELDARANALAAAFVQAGLTRQSKVAAYLFNGPEYLETYFAAFKAGAVPFNTNYRYGGDELTYLFDNADAEAVVFHASFAATADKVRGRLPKVKAWIEGMKAKGQAFYSSRMYFLAGVLFEKKVVAGSKPDLYNELLKVLTAF